MKRERTPREMEIPSVRSHEIEDREGVALSVEMVDNGAFPERGPLERRRSSTEKCLGRRG